MSTYPFRVIKSSWGIAIDLVARLILQPDAPTDALQVAPRVFLRLADSLSLPEDDLGFVRSGLSRVADDLVGGSPGGVAVVELDDVWYGPADYQAEGLEAAIVGWACEQLDIEPPPIEITYDEDSNRYAFSYG